MSAQHTKGPWFVDAHTNVMCSEGLVAFPGIAAGFDQKANARLIAAAPDLLAALRSLVTATDHAEYGAALHASRAVLSKIEGTAA